MTSNESLSDIPEKIDAACETIDFLRFNASYGQQIAEDFRTASSAGIWNRLTMRPLEVHQPTLGLTCAS